MNRVRKAALGLLSLLFLVGCGSSSGGDTDFFGGVPLVDDNTVRRVTVNHNIATAREVGTNVAGFLFQGVSGTTTVFGPTQRGLQTQIVLDVPITATELRIAYLNVNGDIVGVYQQSLPGGTTEVFVNDPDFVDLTNFVTALQFTNSGLTLEVGEQTQAGVTATLLDNSVVDVTNIANLTSSSPNIATVDNGIVSGVAEGQTTLNASLFEFTDSRAVTVVPATATIQ